MANRLLVLLLALAVMFACTSTTTQVTKPPSQTEIEIGQLMANMETAWNSKDVATYSTYFHKDLQFIITDMKTRTNRTVDYETFTKLMPDRMEEIGKVKFADLRILKESPDTAKVFINLKKPDRAYPNYFNLVKGPRGWQVLSNEIAR